MSDNDVAQAIDAGLSFLDGHQLSSGEMPSYWRFPEGGQPEWTPESSPFATSLTVISLARVRGAEELRARAVAFLLSEMEPPGVWRHYSSRSPQHRSAPPDLDDTACASMALGVEGVDAGANRRVLIANRSIAGTFFTWIVPRLPLPLDAGWWRAVWPEILAWPGRRRFWKETSASVGDIDCIVNANVVSYLGPVEATWAASAYLADVVTASNEDCCDTWYPDSVRLYYALSRSIRAGNRVLSLADELIGQRVVKRLGPDGDAGGALSTALAAAALYNLGRREPSYYDALASLLSWQGADGSWSRDVLYVGGPPPSPVWGSEAVTTAACLEALAGYHNDLRLERPPNE